MRMVTCVTSAAVSTLPARDDGDSGDDLMGGSGEQAEHAGCVGGVDGLAEDLSVWRDDDGVGS